MDVDLPEASTVYHDAVAPAWQPVPPWRTHLYQQPENSCQKLLFSATLTRDPAKIAAVGLRKAKYFIVSDGLAKTREAEHLVAETFTFPPGLRVRILFWHSRYGSLMIMQEHMLVTTTQRKPLMLFYLFHYYDVTNALVFTKSAESTQRLVKLLECFEDAWYADKRDKSNIRPVARAYSSELNPAERKAILEDFKSQKISL